MYRIIRTSKEDRTFYLDETTHYGTNWYLYGEFSCRNDDLQEQKKWHCILYFRDARQIVR